MPAFGDRCTVARAVQHEAFKSFRLLSLRFVVPLLFAKPSPRIASLLRGFWAPPELLRVPGTLGKLCRDCYGPEKPRQASKRPHWVH